MFARHGDRRSFPTRRSSDLICNGLRAGALEAVLAGAHEGTRFSGREARYSSFKLWLKYAKPSRGTLLIDAGAVRAVREASARDRKSTRLNSSHANISYAVFC